MIAAAALTFALDTAAESFQLILGIGAGTGLLYLLRWFWWRVNAWSEVAAMVSSFLVALGFFIAKKSGHAVPATESLIITVVTTTIVWVATAFLTPPTDRETLLAFYRKVRPAGPGWREIRAASGVTAAPDSLPQALLGWVLGCTFIYAALFGTGSFLYGRTAQGVFWLVCFVIAAGGLLRLVPRLWPQGAGEAST
jgi:SSS family solute:Na+ symporter